MTFDSNLPSTELVTVLEDIDTRIGILKEDDSLTAITERRELFQKQDMIMSILDNRYEDGKNRMITGLMTPITRIRSISC
jgi:hypothetical protein